MKNAFSSQIYSTAVGAGGNASRIIFISPLFGRPFSISLFFFSPLGRRLLPKHFELARTHAHAVHGQK